MKKILYLILHVSSLFAAHQNNAPLLVQPVRATSPSVPLQIIHGVLQPENPQCPTPLASPTNATRKLYAYDQMEMEQVVGQPEAQRTSAISPPQKPQSPPDRYTMRTQSTARKMYPQYRRHVSYWQRCQFHCFNKCRDKRCPTPCINFCNPFTPEEDEQQSQKDCPLGCCTIKQKYRTGKVLPVPPDEANVSADRAAKKAEEANASVKKQFASAYKANAMPKAGPAQQPPPKAHIQEFRGEKEAVESAEKALAAAAEKALAAAKD